jgi:uncharacterized membrane protein
MAVIRNPIEWGMDQIRVAEVAVESTAHAASLSEETTTRPVPQVRRIGVADLRDALRRGLDDFGACRTDVVLLAIIYPALGLVLGELIWGHNMMALVFPVVSGFALVGPIAGIFLYELSRRRELGGGVAVKDAWGVVRSPSFAGILAMSLILIGIYCFWLIAAEIIYEATLGPEPPVSARAFLHDVFATSAGWAMIVIGCTVGFLFAVLVLAISVVSFPLLLDREASVWTAIATSLHACVENPGTIALWGIIVAAGLLVGSIPLLLGLIIVLPVLGHATWHLYRKLVVS